MGLKGSLTATVRSVRREGGASMVGSMMGFILWSGVWMLGWIWWTWCGNIMELLNFYVVC